ADVRQYVDASASGRQFSLLSSGSAGDLRSCAPAQPADADDGRVHGGAADFEATVAVEQCGIAAVQLEVVVADLEVRDLRTVGAGREVLFDLQPVGGEQGRGGFDHLGGAGCRSAGLLGAGFAAGLLDAGFAAGFTADLGRFCARR